MSIDPEDLERMTDALTALVRAKVERDRAYSECDVDPDYFCSDEDQTVARASEQFGEALRIFIDDRVDARLDMLGGDK